MSSTNQALTYFPISEVAPLIEKKDLSPVELVRATLDRIDAINPEVFAYYTVFADDAMAQAKAAERDIVAGNYKGPLHGIPLALKDVIKDRKTTGGSKTMKDYVAAEKATLVRNLEANGAIIAGKLATYEFAVGTPTLASYYPPARNPWDLTKEPGGSSSGPGAAVAAGLAYGSIGTDTMGSVRYPAYANGITGIKPTYGRVSRSGALSCSWNLDNAGMLTRTVLDNALMLNGCAGYDPRDPASANVPVPDFTLGIDRGVSDLKIGVPWSLFDSTCLPEILEGFKAALAVMEGLGATIVDLPGPDHATMMAISWIIVATEIAAAYKGSIKANHKDFSKDTVYLCAFGSVIPSALYVNAQRVRQQMRITMLAQLEKVDLFMLPTSGVHVPPILDAPPERWMGESQDLLLFYTPIFDLTGVPALSTPCGFLSTGLPNGFQLAGRPFDEATVYRAAYAYEHATRWCDRHPPL